jgi:predicted phosphoribosyltransferase
MFEDRQDAGRQLGRALEKYRDKAVVVLAIPRGGVQVGYEVARYLNATLSILIARKLPFPDEPEAGFGAIAEDGSTFLADHADDWLPRETITRIMHNQRSEILRRIDALRGGRPLPDIRGTTIILVDDGIAMGSTMRAGIAMCKNLQAGKIVVAVPVTGERQTREIGQLVDEIVVLERPRLFRAVAQVYSNWYDVSDEEVIGIINKWEQESGDTQLPA